MPFEPLKLITLVIAMLLLAPIALVFWRIAVYCPQPHVEYRAQLEATWREFASPIETTNEDGSVTVTVAAPVQNVDLIGFSLSNSSWLSFYPRRWVGIAGLLAVITILGCLVVSLFIPVFGELMTPPQ